MRIQLASSAFVWLICCSVQAGIINVPDDQPTIQLAINAANPGDVVIVAEGEYFENINFFGKAITVRSTDPTDPAVVMNTIINGGGSGTVVACTNGEGANTVLSGLVITNGNGNPGGGGMFNGGSSPTVTNCTFSGNSAGQGGGMINNSSSPTVTNCILWDGIRNGDSSPTVSFSDVQGGLGAGTTNGGGNINADPLFVDDLRLSAGSPCIDAGDNTAVPAGITTDLDGNPRFVDDLDTPDTGNPEGVNPIVDMGVFESHGTDGLARGSRTTSRYSVQ